MEKGFKKIILVDDDEDDRDIFSDAFRNLKIQADLLLLKNGQQLLNYIDKIDHSVPTIVFLDLNMPIVSGIDCLKCLRDKITESNFFVTIYSTSASKTDVDNAFRHGANGYIKKPAGFQQLQEVILKTINSLAKIQGRQLPKDKFLFNK